MEKRNKRNNGIFYVVISLILVLGLVGFVRADISLKELIANKVATILGEKISTELGLIVPEEDVSLGAMPGPDVYQEMFFHEQVLSDFAVSRPIAVPATTTLNYVLGNGRDLTAVVASYTNTTGKTLVCEDVRVPIITSSDTWVYSFGVGTTTKIASSPSWTNTTTATLIASTTATAAYDVTANKFGYFTSKGNPGSYFTVGDSQTVASTTAFNLESGVSIVAYIHTIDATSSDSFEKKDGHKLTGSLQANCHYIDY